jgi:hypothetical protein
MHPEILRELTSLRNREMRDQAHRVMLSRMANKARRARRHAPSRPHDGDAFVVPAIPDYVDGAFRVTSADDKAGRVPTTHRAS